MKYVAVQYNMPADWVLDYTDDYLIYDRSDTDKFSRDLPKDKVIRCENIGHIDFSKLNYLVDHYYDLPDVFYWGKINLFKSITRPEFEKVKDAKEFLPLLRPDHPTYSDKFGVVCYYQDGMYYERNDSWYLNEWPARFPNWQAWANEFALPSPEYIPFPPGGNFILTREKVHRYSRDYYEKMKDTLPYCRIPGESMLAERSYYLMWR